MKSNEVDQILGGINVVNGIFQGGKDDGIPF